MQKTKKSMLASGLAVLVCVAMLIGATFAWFTDSVTNKGNRIEAGNLQIDLLMDKDGKGTYESIADGSGDIFSEAAGNGNLWEPGKTEIVYLAVQNKGSLALNYNILLDVVDNGLIGSLEYAVLDGKKAADLENVRTWEELKAQAGEQVGDVTAGRTVAAPNGTLDEIVRGVEKETEYFALAVHMKEDAGNTFQNGSISIDVNVIAKQAQAESDGFGNSNYDEGAVWPVSSSDGMKEAIDNAEDGDTIALTGDIRLDMNQNLIISKKLTIDGMGNAMLTNRPVTVTANVTFKNISLSKPVSYSAPEKKDATILYAEDGCEELILEGCTFSDPQWEVMQITSSQLKKLIVDGCTFTAANVDTVPHNGYNNKADEALRYIHIELKNHSTSTTEIVITNNIFKNCDKLADSIVGIYFVDGSITVGGNQFEGLSDEEINPMLSVGWPEMAALKDVTVWKGAQQTFELKSER